MEQDAIIKEEHEIVLTFPECKEQIVSLYIKYDLSASYENLYEVFF